jgi:alpha-beta hydrolase superfamily lysophospholipase
LFFQSKNDTVVDWGYNIPFLEAKLPNSKVIMLDKGLHSLQYEKDEIRDDFFTLLINELEEAQSR